VYPGSFYARSLATLSLISGLRSLRQIREYVPKALTADEYSLLRSSVDIGRSIFTAYYYGSDEDRQAAKGWGQQWSAATEIGKNEPRLSWAYYGGIQYEMRPIEREFIRALIGTTRGLNRKVYQLTLRANEEFFVQFTDEMLTTIRDFHDRGSLFAGTLTNYMNDAEVWNIMATTVFNNKKAMDAQSLDAAATLYSFAKCFARSGRDYDQKYCYNYIRCKALFFETSKRLPDPFYLNQVAFYISRSSSALFTYKEECVTPYMHLVSLNWGELSAELKTALSVAFARVEWLKRRFQRDYPALFSQTS
jgi:hypothetical protein